MKDAKSPEGKKKFMAEEFERSTRQIYNNHPMYYLYTLPENLQRWMNYILLK
ncbi:MAG: hypothetical protein MZV70_77410 [Desulfobacterales bacterium]|nr:hypothetical protein [Desulfobacterales bacterium]